MTEIRLQPVSDTLPGLPFYASIWHNAGAGGKSHNYRIGAASACRLCRVVQALCRHENGYTINTGRSLTSHERQPEQLARAPWNVTEGYTFDSPRFLAFVWET